MSHHNNSYRNSNSSRDDKSYRNHSRQYQRNNQQDYSQYRRKNRSRSRSPKKDSNDYGRSRQKERDRSYQKHNDRYQRSHQKSYDHYKNYERYDRHDRGERDQRYQRTERRQVSQSYDERAVQQIEQKVRLAIRNNQIHYDPKIHQLFTSMTAEKQDELTSQAQSSQRIGQNILVRELYISGLLDMNEQLIAKIMSKYGEIQSIEILKNFAFVKFFKIEDASNACSEYHTINMTLHSSHNPGFKMFFTDHTKRWNVVSNHPNYQMRDYLIPVLYLSVKNDPQFNNEQYLRSLFGRYGFIRNIQIQKIDIPTTKVYALIEFETMVQAIRARDRMRSQRDKLGDRRCDVTVLVDCDQIIRVFPNISNQLRYQKNRGGAHNRPPNMLVNPFGPPTMAPTHNSMGMDKNSMIMGNHRMGMNMNNQMNMLVDRNIVDKGAEDIYEMLKQLADKDEPQKDHSEADWVGFMARNKGFKVEVDMKQIHKVPFELQGIMNVSHRGYFQDGLNRPNLHMAAKFSASNKFGQEAFNGYIKYFASKKRAGVIQTREYLIYLFPPLEELNLPYAVKETELLALFYKSPVGQVPLPIH